MRDGGEEKTVLWFAGRNGGTSVTALQQGSAAIDAQPALELLAGCAVTFVAMLCEDWTNAVLEEFLSRQCRSCGTCAARHCDDGGQRALEKSEIHAVGPRHLTQLA